ncbi:MAG: hypothetical protein L3J69_02700 [Desulfobacula sp.]|nr:hypothetical protein [Desulfobacula sp.]
MEQENKKLAPPQMSPYVFTILLIGFGLWCFRDGWMNPDPDYEHALFNQVLSVILLPWGIWDFYKLRKKSKNDSEDK